jgi:hypothetical protein
MGEVHIDRQESVTPWKKEGKERITHSPGCCTWLGPYRLSFSDLLESEKCHLNGEG